MAVPAAGAVWLPFFLDTLSAAPTFETHEPSRDPDRPAEAFAMGLAVLRTMPTPRPYGFHATDYPVGSRRIERPTTALRAMHEMRRQGRDATASGLG